MPAPAFRFKQFAVSHDRCAMKVGTDGVLLGAWADIKGAKRVLDIGTGSGLIALMLAQRISTAGTSRPFIDAVEIDLDASKQAVENIEDTPWSDWISIHHNSIQSYSQTCQHRYDLIVSNPPFFSDGMASNDLPRSVARHTQELSLEALVRIADQLLTDESRLCMIYPVTQAETLIHVAEAHDLFLSQMLRVQPTPELPVKRILVDLRRGTGRQPPRICSTETIALEIARHSYTSEFIALIQDFYLKY